MPAGRRPSPRWPSPSRSSGAPDQPQPRARPPTPVCHADRHHPLRSKTMRGAVLHAPGDIRVDDRPDPKIEKPSDALIQLAATSVCGSDLWPYRGIESVDGPAPMGHEYVGIVEEVGSDVRNVRPGQFVVGSFFASDNTCEICQAGYQSATCTPSSSARSEPRPSTPASRWPTARWSPPPSCPPTTWCPACWPPPTS